MNVAVLLSAARVSSGLSRAQLASRAGIDPTVVAHAEHGADVSFATVERLLAAAGHRLYSAPIRRDDVATAAAGIREQLRNGDRQHALRLLIQLNDDMVAEHGLLRGVLGLVEPAPTGEPAWDAALAALVAWRMHEEELPLPGWVSSTSRYLNEPSTLDIDPADPTPSRADIPDEFAERGILLWRGTFQST